MVCTASGAFPAISAASARAVSSSSSGATTCWTEPKRPASAADMVLGGSEVCARRDGTARAADHHRANGRVEAKVVGDGAELVRGCPRPRVELLGTVEHDLRDRIVGSTVESNEGLSRAIQL